jgi:hypothetical protein
MHLGFLNTVARQTDNEIDQRIDSIAMFLGTEAK